jgi:hypothetical protein
VLAETQEKQAGVAVPAAALVRNGANELIVWVHERAERFVARRVRTAPLDAQRVLVLAGLEGRERVVVQGALAPVRMIAPMALSWWAWWKASINCLMVSGRKALRRSGRLMVIRAMPSAAS